MLFLHLICFNTELASYCNQPIDIAVLYRLLFRLYILHPYVSLYLPLNGMIALTFVYFTFTRQNSTFLYGLLYIFSIKKYTPLDYTHARHTKTEHYIIEVLCFTIYNNVIIYNYYYSILSKTLSKYSFQYSSSVSIL